jgi:hypothetical protein
MPVPDVPGLEVVVPLECQASVKLGGTNTAK